MKRLIFRCPTLKPVDFDDYVDQYDALLRKETSFFSEDDTYFAQYKVKIARRLVGSQPTHVLEFGCGIGRNIPYLQENFPSAVIHGSDVSGKSLDMARQFNPGVHFYREDGSVRVFSRYDFIFVAGVMHHVRPEGRNEVLCAIRERLKPDGKMVIFEHNPYNPFTRRIVTNCPYDAGAILLSPKELSHRLCACGFKVVTKGYALFFPNRLRALARLDRFLKCVPLGGQYYILASA